MRNLIFILVLFSVGWAHSKEHKILKRIAVFPFSASNLSPDLLEKSWWKIREELARPKRFLVASRLFMQNKEVFQRRAQLETVDAAILGKLLDAHGLVTGFIRKDSVELHVYDGRTGQVLWQDQLPLDPDVPVNIQFEKSLLRLTRAFIASIPYQGYTIADKESGSVTFSEGDVRVARVKIGTNHSVQEGSAAYWISVVRKGIEPLFQGGGGSSVYARGKVLRVEGDEALVEILNYNQLSDFVLHSMVRFPSEVIRLQSDFALRKSPVDQLASQYIKTDTKKEEKKQKNALLNTLSYIGSFIVFLVLAL